MRSRATTAALVSSSRRRADGDLDRRETALEGLGERAVDGALKTSLEAVQQAQGGPLRLRMIVSEAPVRGPYPKLPPRRDNLAQSILGSAGEREWRNWQTRTVQVRVPVRAWGFKSPLAHHCYGSLPCGHARARTITPAIVDAIGRVVGRPDPSASAAADAAAVPAALRRDELDRGERRRASSARSWSGSGRRTSRRSRTSTSSVSTPNCAGPASAASSTRRSSSR